MELHLSHKEGGKKKNEGPVRMGGPQKHPKVRRGESKIQAPSIKINFYLFLPFKKPLALTGVSNKYQVTQANLAGT